MQGRLPRPRWSQRRRPERDSGGQSWKPATPTAGQPPARPRCSSRETSLQTACQLCSYPRPRPEQYGVLAVPAQGSRAAEGGHRYSLLWPRVPLALTVAQRGPDPDGDGGPLSTACPGARGLQPRPSVLLAPGGPRATVQGPAPREPGQGRRIWRGKKKRFTVSKSQLEEQGTGGSDTPKSEGAR